VLATGPNSPFCSSLCSTQTWTIAGGLPTPNTRTVAIGPVLHPTTRHFNLTTLPPNPDLSSDCIVTSTICRLCSFSRSFTACFYNCDAPTIHGVAIENPEISHKIERHFTAIQRIVVRSQIWQREVEELLKLHNLRIDHVMIWSEHNNLIAGRVVGTVKWNRSPGNNLALISRLGCPGCSWPGLVPVVQFQPRQQPGNLEPLLKLPLSNFTAVRHIRWYQWESTIKQFL